MAIATPETVAAAASGLAAKGVRPTVEMVRQALGGGSPNTITKHLKDWRATTRQSIAPADLSPALVRALQMEIGSIVAAEKAALAADLETAEADLAGMADQVERLEGENTRLANLNATLIKARDAAEAEAKAAKAEQEREAAARKEAEYHLTEADRRATEEATRAAMRETLLAASEADRETLRAALAEAREKAARLEGRLEALTKE